MKAKQKRIVRGYKIAHTPYVKARKRANGKLATMIEQWVTDYGKGFDIYMFERTVGEIRNLSTGEKTLTISQSKKPKP